MNLNIKAMPIRVIHRLAKAVICTSCRDNLVDEKFAHSAHDFRGID